MLQKIFTKYWLVITVGFTVLSTWFVLPGSNSSLSMISLLWLSLLSAEVLVVMPSVRNGESLNEARIRTLKAIAGDAYLYIGLLMAAYLFVQWFNGGCAPEYDVNAGIWSYSKPDKEWLPTSVNQLDSLRMFNIFAACVVLGLSLRNAVGKRSKRYLLQWLSSLSGILAALCVWQGLAGNASFARLMENTELSSLGSFFGFWLIMGIGSYADSLTFQQRRTEIIYILAIICNFVGMLFFAQLLSLLLYSVIFLVLLIYLGIYLLDHVKSAFLVKFYLLTFLIIVSVLGLSIMTLPQSVIPNKIAMAADLPDYWQGLQESKAVRSHAALEIWKENMWFGKGAEGFKHYLGTVLDDQGWSRVRINKESVYNDVLQFLCEFGLLGSAILSALIVSLIIPLCYRAHIAWGKEDADHLNVGRKYLLRISPFVVTGVIATLSCFGESFIASPYRLPGLFISVFVVMLTLPAFLPSK